MSLIIIYIQIIMSKRPFNKIRRIQKKQNIDQAEENKEQFKIQQNASREKNSKPPIFSLEKKKIKISSNDPSKNNEDNRQPEQKITLGSKPNLFRGKKDSSRQIPNNLPSPASIETPVQQNYSEAPKPTPLLIKKRFLEPKNREGEGVVIEEQSYQKNNFEQSKELNVEQSIGAKRRPDLKIKRFLQKRQPSEKVDEIEDSSDYMKSNNEIPFQRQSNALAPIQYRQISIEPSIVSISQGRIAKQNKRTHDLKNLLNLQMDLYEQTLSISSITPYEIYINKIKSGFLKNSNDQAYDDKTANSTQTLSFEQTDFTNQCPQDYSVDINKIEKIDSSAMFDQFILKIAPIIEELMKPADTITEPPIFLLAFRPSFKAFLKCPYPTFIYRSQEFNLDLIVMGQKLYITQGEIVSVLMIGKNIIAGLKNGQLMFWNGLNNKSCRLYQQIKQFTQTTNFQLPSFSTHQFDRFSSYASVFSIVNLIHLQNFSFLSLDSTGKIVKWNIEESSKGIEQIKPISVIQLKSLTQHWALEAYSIKLRGESYYINTSIGIVCLHNQQIRQKLDIEGIKIITFQVPKKSPLVYAVNENNTLIIFNQQYSHRLFEMNLQIGSELITEIIIPEIEHQNRQIMYLFIIYLIDTSGKIYELKILQNKIQYVKKLGDEDDHENRKDKNAIFKGVIRVGQNFQIVKLMRDLKITSSFLKININTAKTIPNLKLIIQRNRLLMTLLEIQSIMIL